MKLKKTLAILTVCLALCGIVGGFASCKDKSSGPGLKIVALKGGRGPDYVNNLAAEYKKLPGKSNLNIVVEMIEGTTIDTELTSAISSGSGPDLLFVSTGTKEDTVGNLIRGKQLADISDVMDITVPGESVKVKDKLFNDVTQVINCQPYGDGKTYLMPIFFSPNAYFYNKSLFVARGSGAYTPIQPDNKFMMPATEEEFWALGDALGNGGGRVQLNGQNVYLFTYPTAGYFDNNLSAAIAEHAGTEKFLGTRNFKEGIWQDADVKKALTYAVRLGGYCTPNTVANAANTAGEFIRNQQAVINGETGTKTTAAGDIALFIPNGDWLPAEMESTTPDGFEWGFVPVFAPDGKEVKIAAYYETAEIFKNAKNIGEAKNFLAFYYSDKAAEIVAENCDAITPVKNARINAEKNGISPFVRSLFEYEAGVVSAAFAATKPVAGINWNDILYNDVRLIHNGTKYSAATIAEKVELWAAALETASSSLRANKY